MSELKPSIKSASLNDLESIGTEEMEKRLSIIFQDEPRQWGLRGDPYLWKEMKKTLGDIEFPDSEDDLLSLLLATYERLTGEPLDRGREKPLYIERYSHGGMSSGKVSPAYWLETAIPLLRARYRDHSSGHGRCEREIRDL